MTTENNAVNDSARLENSAAEADNSTSLTIQLHPETGLLMMSPTTNPDMAEMMRCTGTCSHVPDQVIEVIVSAMEAEDRITQARQRQAPQDGALQSLDDDTPRRTARINAVAQRMAHEGWRFCVCFMQRKTPTHALVYELVLTNAANSLADGMWTTYRRIDTGVKSVEEQVDQSTGAGAGA